jgi:GH24 family phage-related lysozyme (muramidase)
LIPRYREHVRGLVPWKIQHYIWTHCYGSVGSMQELKKCGSPVSEPEALAVLEQLRRAPDLTAELRFWMVNIHNGLSLMRAVQAEATQLARDVSNERDRA